jgi:hypothetical protein
MRLLCGFIAALIAITMGLDVGARPQTPPRQHPRTRNRLRTGTYAKGRGARRDTAEHINQETQLPFQLLHRVPGRTRPPSQAAALHTTLPPPQHPQRPVAECVSASRTTELGQEFLPHLAPRPPRSRVGSIRIQPLIQNPLVMLRDWHLVRILGDSIPELLDEGNPLFPRCRVKLRWNRKFGSAHGNKV